jgi:hypothetical protein
MTMIILLGVVPWVILPATVFCVYGTVNPNPPAIEEPKK